MKLSTKKNQKNQIKTVNLYSKEKTQTRRVFRNKDYLSGDGMLTTIWGPNMWHYLHTLSFNYPIQPTAENKKYYKQFVLNLQYTLPCKYCRNN